MRLEGNGDVMRLVTDTYLSAGRKKKERKKCEVRKYLFPEVQRRDLDNPVTLAATAKEN